jgi:thioredoxin reductase (NADPH)
VHLFIRGASLEHSMSHYLIERIVALPNVTLHRRIELGAHEGEARLERVHYRDADGVERSMATHHLFVFIGAQPNTGWLRTCGVTLDDKGFVLTGADVAALPLQTSVPGVFAIGDVRSGSTKRVASAVGEGAAVVAQIHSLLAASR